MPGTPVNRFKAGATRQPLWPTASLL